MSNTKDKKRWVTMILLYEWTKGEKEEAIRQFLTNKNIAFRDIDASLAHVSLKDLFAGKGEANKDAQATGRTAICFSEDTDPEEAGMLMSSFENIGFVCDDQVLGAEDNLDKPLEVIFKEHAEYGEFLKKIAYLQGLINSTGQLQAENYDPDLWSELKFAVADGNDFLDAIFSDDESKLSEVEPDDIDKHTENLRKAMKKLLG